jgi:Xaa-Pro aminopeptidase
LDAIAHAQLWNEGMNYGHGTGHGIGHFLCVHEGPQRISARGTNIPLEINMILSDEPGVYRTGKHGIRIENMMIVRPFEENEFGKFLQFETVTLFPYNRKLIDVKMLTEKEITWVNQYNQRVYEKISPCIKEEKILNWLKEETKKV